jgi:hypothetical protein
MRVYTCVYIYYTQYVYCTQNLSKFNVSKWKFGTEAEHAYEGLAGDSQEWNRRRNTQNLHMPWKQRHLDTYTIKINRQRRTEQL